MKSKREKNTGKKYSRPPVRKRNLDIVYEDADLIVVNKPAGLLTVPIPKTKAQNLLDLLNTLLAPKKEKAITVHRIDRFTTGIVLFAKNSSVHGPLVRQFLDHKPVRTYLALVRNVMETDEGELIHYMKKVSVGFRNVVVKPGDPEGSMARLTFKVLERHFRSTLVQINLDTGLKNQIRVQFAAIGHPLVGDRHYAPEELNENLIDRQALHSSTLTITHPRTGKLKTFKARTPNDFSKALNHYRNLNQ